MSKGFPEAGNYNLRTTTLGIFFMREHNRLARALHKINPCWKDDRLFKVARQINIATAASIYMYELLPALLGKFLKITCNQKSTCKYIGSQNFLNVIDASFYFVSLFKITNCNFFLILLCKIFTNQLFIAKNFEKLKLILFNYIFTFIFIILVTM